MQKGKQLRTRRHQKPCFLYQEKGQPSKTETSQPTTTLLKPDPKEEGKEGPHLRSGQQRSRGWPTHFPASLGTPTPLPGAMLVPAQPSREPGFHPYLAMISHPSCRDASGHHRPHPAARRLCRHTPHPAPQGSIRANLRESRLPQLLRGSRATHLPSAHGGHGSGRLELPPLPTKVHQ